MGTRRRLDDAFETRFECDEQELLLDELDALAVDIDLNLDGWDEEWLESGDYEDEDWYQDLGGEG